MPEKMFTNDDGKERIIDEMWTGDWWWELQVSRHAKKSRCSRIVNQNLLPLGATI